MNIPNCLFSPPPYPRDSSRFPLNWDRKNTLFEIHRNGSNVLFFHFFINLLILSEKKFYFFVFSCFLTPKTGLFGAFLGIFLGCLQGSFRNFFGNRCKNPQNRHPGEERFTMCDVRCAMCDVRCTGFLLTAPHCAPSSLVRGYWDGVLSGHGPTSFPVNA